MSYLTSMLRIAAACTLVIIPATSIRSEEVILDWPEHSWSGQLPQLEVRLPMPPQDDLPAAAYPTGSLPSFDRVRPRSSFRARWTEYRLPGEFEQQSTLLMGGCEMTEEMPDLFADIVDAVAGSIDVCVMVNDSIEQRLACEILAARQIEAAHVFYAHIRHNTMWARDYGPRLVGNEKGEMAIADASYGLGGRNDDDAVPEVFADALKVPVLHTQVSIEGGNILSNGEGVCVTTAALVESNPSYSEASIRDTLRSLYGAQEIVVLEPLISEPTGHVDMFATFTSPNTIVLGKYDPAVDPINAAVLERNARTLSLVRTRHGPLRVVRIPMPDNRDEVWRTYTNVLYANGVLLVPVYPDVDRAGQREALRVYSRQLPGWKMITIDASVVSQRGGALHCVAMNLGRIDSMRLRNPRTDFRPVIDAVVRPDPSRLSHQTGGHGLSYGNLLAK